MTYEAESDFCMAVSSSLLKNYKGQIETKFSAFYQYKRIAIRSKKQLWTDDIEHIVECLSEEFEKQAMSRLKWTSKPKFESGRISPNFLFSVVFVYRKNCWKTLFKQSSLNTD